MKISIYIANKKYKASSYYRIVQYIDDMNMECKTCVYEFFPNWYYKIIRSVKFKTLNFIFTCFMHLLGYVFRGIYMLGNILSKEDEIVFVQSEIFLKRVPLVFRGLLKRYLKRAKRIVWDFDKSILNSKEMSLYEFNILKKTNSLIIIGHDGTQDILEYDISHKGKVLRTTDKMLKCINVYEVNKERLSYYNDKIVLLWIGESKEINNLRNIVPNLETLAKKLRYKELILKVVCDKNLDMKTENLIIENIKFSKKNAFKEMLKAHIAIMCTKNCYELRESIYTNLIQYIGTGLPVVVSENNIAIDFIKNNNGYLIKKNIDFEKTILYLTEKSIWKNKSNLSRKLWEDEFKLYCIK